MHLSHSKKRKADINLSLIIDSFYSPTHNTYFSLIAVFLIWFIGRDKAEEILLSKRIATEEMVFQMPAQVNSAFQNPQLRNSGSCLIKMLERQSYKWVIIYSKNE